MTISADALAGVGIVIVTHDSADELPATLTALVEQTAPGDRIVIVDNASADDSVALARRLVPGATVIESKENAGFAAGCNRGVRELDTALVMLLNPDVVVAPGCLDALRHAAIEQPDWGAWQALVTMDGGATVNTAGNVVHFLGFGWAGRCGEPVEVVPERPYECGFASGAAMVVRRALWQQLGGFDERYFMYVEDLDLSLRLRLAGHGVGVVPAARAEHGYDFVKGDYKWFLLERNRWWTLVAAYPRRVLLLTLPWLALFELVLLPAALRGGWLGAKLRAQCAVVRLMPAMLRRRRAVQATRTIGAAEFAAGLEASLDSPFLRGAAAVPGLDRAQRAVWRLICALL